MSLELGVRITWLGHSTFLFAGPDGETLLVDPFTASNPKCPESMHSFERLDAVAITHGHQDHMADTLDIYAANRAPIVAIAELAVWLRSQGVADEDVVDMNKGGTVSVAGVKVTMTDANHSAGIFFDGGVVYGGEPAGFILTFSNGTRIYHAGDTNVFGDMALIGELYRPDVVILPIGDHYTMGPFEAAKACELLGAPVVVPMHYGTFPVLVGTPEQLRMACAERGVDVAVVAPEPGETIA